MALNKVKLIEELAKNLQEWADNQSYTHSPTFIRFVPDFGQKKVILLLLTEKLMLKVQEDFKVLQEKVDILNSLSARPITENEYHEDFCPQVDEVKSIAADLVETLRYITAVDDLSNEKSAETGKNTDKILGDKLSLYGLEIHWRVLWDKLKKPITNLKTFLRRDK